MREALISHLLDQRSAAVAPPPPYSAAPVAQGCAVKPQANDHDVLVIDATTVVHGTGNIVGSDLVLAKLQPLLASLLQRGHTAADEGGPMHGCRPLKIQLSCGIRVVGTRNVVGGVQLRAPAAQSPFGVASTPAPTSSTSATSAGYGLRSSKRKAEDETTARGASKRPDTAAE